MSRTGGASYCDYGYDILRHPRTALSGRSITSFSPRRLFPSDGQAGSYQLARWVSTEKRACIDWYGHFRAARRRSQIRKTLYR
jgi:hypothetical protein